MRLGLVRYRYAAGGGAEKSLLMLASGLAARGHEVHVGVSEWVGDKPEGVAVHQTGAKAASKEFAHTVRGLMEGLKLDTWLSLERVPGSPMLRTGDGVHAAWLKRRAPYQNLLKRFYCAMQPKNRGLLDLEKRTFGYDSLKKVIANSNMVAGELTGYFGLPPEKIELIYNGVNGADSWREEQARAARRQVRSELGVDRDVPVMLFLGSGFQRKGLGFAINALTHLPRVQLWVAGRDRTTAFKFQAKRLGVSGRVRFLGQRGDADRLLAAADLMCLPTIYDPCANSVLEALAAQTPVVTTLGNGAGELIDQGVNGYLVGSPQESDVLAGVVQKALRLKTPFSHRVPGYDEMIERTAASMEAVVRSAES